MPQGQSAWSVTPKEESPVQPQADPQADPLAPLMCMEHGGMGWDFPSLRKHHGNTQAGGKGQDRPSGRGRLATWHTDATQQHVLGSAACPASLCAPGPSPTRKLLRPKALVCSISVYKGECLPLTDKAPWTCHVQCVGSPPTPS